MILADTSVWIDHFRVSNAELFRLLLDREIVIHPSIVGEIALGGIADRRNTLARLLRLPRTEIAEFDEVIEFIEAWRLFGRGVGYIDAQLLASSLKTPGQYLWTQDRRLATAAVDVGVPLYTP